MAQAYVLTDVDNPRDVQEAARQLSRSARRGELTAAQVGAAIATVDKSGRTLPHSFGLSWILQNLPDFVANFDPRACRDLFLQHLDNPYIDRAIEDDRLFGLLTPPDQEFFLRKVVEHCPILGARWIITATVRGIHLPTVLELIFTRLKGVKPTAIGTSAFVASFLLASHTNQEGEFDTWSPFIGSRNKDESLVEALKLCAMHCPELFFSPRHDLRLERRFADHGIDDDDLVMVYDTAARHLMVGSFAHISTEILEKHGYVTGIPTLTMVSNKSTGEPEQAYILECTLAGKPTTFLQEAPSGYLHPRHPVIVYFRQPAVTRRHDIGMYVTEFIMPRVSGAVG